APIAIPESSKIVNLDEPFTQDEEISVGSVEDTPVKSVTEEIPTEAFEQTQTLEIKQVLQDPVARDEQVDRNIPAKITVLTQEEIEFKQITEEPALRCPHCNEEHPAGSQFCPVTGRKILLPGVCPECGQPVEPQWQQCGYCGKELIQVVAIPHQQEAQTIDSQKVRWLIIGALLVAGGIACLLIGMVIVFNNFWKGANPKDATPMANIAPISSPISSPIAPTAIIVIATTIAPTQAVALPTFTPTPAVPNCPGMEIQSESRTGGIFLLICAKDQRYEVGPLADGVYKVGPNNMFFIYITYSGEVYAARIGDKKLTYIDRIKFFTMILKDDEPRFEIKFYGDHPYQLYVKEFFENQDKTIPIPRYITTPNY
ncbi:MAG: zinc ribbon domain-containing protein, partial [Anaerolineales bacterium]|nr:zinc ribbon domain-containing protein [Anaerolineales bacterium]